MSICRRRKNQSPRCAVVVLGDLDRSPRMLNHALSLATLTGYEVDMIGYRGNSLPATHLNAKNIHARYLSTKLIDKLRELPRALYVLYALLRIIIQIIQLIWVFQSEHYDYVIMQNPPCVPLMLVLALLKILRVNKQRVIIDWHNYGYSIMRVNRVNKFLVGVGKIYEILFSKIAGDYHLCVSQAMQVDLINKFKLKSQPHVLYDLATKKFKQVNMQEKHELFAKYDLKDTAQEENKTSLTEYNPDSKSYQYKQNRKALIISSTSYTPDEDFMVMIQALDKLQEKIDQLSAINKNFKFPQIQVIVTGKGPQKEHYQQIFENRNLQWKDINIRTAWLEIDDYPKIVAASDLGVCLHYSSSGLDLPMKVVDMFSAKLPCLAYKYLAIDELVQDGQNGRVFSDDSELMEQIFDTLKAFESQNQEGATDIIRKYKKNLEKFNEEDWDSQWKRVVLGKIIVWNK